MSRHSERAGIALRALNEADPAMAALALWCDHRDGAQGRAATRGTIITYGPGFAALPRHEQVGLAAHHVLHVALRHSARMAAMEARMGEAFDAEVYGIAADAIVNEALLAAGYALPRPALGLSALLAEVTGQPLAPREALAEWDADRLYIRLMQGGPGEGRAADRAKRHAKAKSFEPDVEQDKTRGAPAEAEDAALWRQHLARALEAGRLAGRGIGLIGHRLADIPQPATPWEVVLRGLVTRAVIQAPRISHQRPARAWVAAESEARRSGRPMPAFQPGTLRDSDAPRIVVGLDASSSVDDVRLGLFMAEIAGIARRAGAEVQVIAFDEAPRPALRLNPARWKAQLAAMEVPRGGGTSFAPMIAAAVALRPSILLVLTDLEGDPGPAPRLPVIWAVPDAAVPPDVPFGTVLSLAR